MNNYTQEEARAIVISVLRHLIASKEPIVVLHMGFEPHIYIPKKSFDEIMAIWGIKPEELVDKGTK